VTLSHVAVRDYLSETLDDRLRIVGPGIDEKHLQTEALRLRRYEVGRPNHPRDRLGDGEQLSVRRQFEGQEGEGIAKSDGLPHFQGRDESKDFGIDDRRRQSS
jgi:hypothetical protein